MICIKKLQQWSASLLILILCCTGCQGLLGVKRSQLGLSVVNLSNERISQVEILYGDQKISFCRISCVPTRDNDGGSVWSAYMPIEEKMTISWLDANKDRHELTIPIRERVVDINRLRRLNIVFHDGQVVVEQYLSNKNKNIFFYEELPLYP